MKGMPAQFTIDTHQQVCKQILEFLCVFRSSISDLPTKNDGEVPFPLLFFVWKINPIRTQQPISESLVLNCIGRHFSDQLDPRKKKWILSDGVSSLCGTFGTAGKGWSRVIPPLKVPRFRVLCLGGIWRDNEGLHMVLIRPAISWGERWQLAPLLNCHPGLAQIFCWEIWGGYDKWWSFQEIFWEWVYKRPSIWLGDYPVTDSYWFQKRDPAPVRKSATSKPFC